MLCGHLKQREVGVSPKMSNREIELAEFIAEEFELETIRLAILMIKRKRERARKCKTITI